MEQKPNLTMLPRSLLWVLVFGAIVRLLVWGVFAGDEIYVGDAKDYDRLAVGLVETGRYLTEAGAPSCLRPPLYPWLVAAGYQLFGVQNHDAIRLAQAALSLVNVVIVYRLGLLLFSGQAAVVAAALFCFYPSMLGFNNLILSETLFTLLASLAVLLTGEAIQRHSLRWLAVAGIVLGLGVLTRSILWLYLPFLTLFLLIVWEGDWGRKAAAGLVLVAAFVVTIAPWAYRNTKVQKTLTLIDVMGGRNVMMGNYEHTPLERSWATVDTVPYQQSWIRVLIEEHGPVRDLTQGQIDKLAMRHGIRFMMANPGLTLKRTAVRFFNFWQLDRTLVAGLQNGHWQALSKPMLMIVLLIIVGYYAALMYLGIFGVLFAKPRDRVSHWLFLFSIAFPCLVHSAIFAHSRYHLPVMPLVVIYSAFAIVSGRDIVSSSRSRFVACLVLAALLTLGWIREIVVVDLAQMSGTM